MKIIIGNGKVSQVLRNKDDVILSHKDVEITDVDSVFKNLSRFSPGDVVINTAAKINLEWCESNKEESYSVNVSGALNVANACKELGLHLVHISSGCIFDGMESEKIYSEEEIPTPACWYAETKYVADLKIMNIGYEKITIVRPRQLVSSIPNPTNMLTKFMSIEVGKFIDSKNSMTCIEDMKEMIDHLIDKKEYGIFNLANDGHTSPYRIALMIKDYFGTKNQVSKISYDDYSKIIKVKRVNTILSIDKIKKSGFNPRSTESALMWCLENYGKN